MIPDTIHPDVKSNAERRMFDIIKYAENSERWICLHSLGIGLHEYQRSGEIDFLLITENGIFVLEIKGGRVSRSNGKWIFTNRYGQSNVSSRGPFEQARSAMYSLENRIKKEFGSESRLGRLLSGYGVVAPDCRLKEEVIIHEGTENFLLVYDIDDRRFPLRHYIDRLTQATRETQNNQRFSPSKDDANSLVQFLRGNFDAVIPLSAVTENVCREIKTLEPAQYAVLDALNDQPRYIVQGAAGTGKTLLALESVRRSEWKGHRVLFLCYNRLLAEYLRKQLSKSSKNIVISSIYAFINDLIMQSSYGKDLLAARQESDDDALYTQIYPELGQYAAMEVADGYYDDLIIDEGQDIMVNPLLDILDIVLKGGLEAGKWRVFLDSNNQASVYGRFDQEAYQRLKTFGQLTNLVINFRNTKQIANETRIITVPTVFAPSHIEGSPVEYIWFKDTLEQEKKLQNLLTRLIRIENIKPNRITILSPIQNREFIGLTDNKCDFSIQKITENNIAAFMNGSITGITWSTVSSFKGLENDVIVLTDVEDLNNSWWRSVVYVGMMRARVCLYLLLNAELKEIYTERVTEWLKEDSETYFHMEGNR
jgi:hypothetical protein